MTRTMMICEECGSSDVMLDAWAVWDAESDAWVLGQTFDAGHCAHCDGEARIVEIEIEHPADVDRYSDYVAACDFGGREPATFGDWLDQHAEELARS